MLVARTHTMNELPMRPARRRYNQTVGLSELCVRRPIFAFMLIMFLVVMGVFSFAQLGVDLFPKSDPAQAFVRVRLPGSSPEEMVSQVVLPLEESIASVSGIDELKAYVFEGEAMIQVTFVLERDRSEEHTSELQSPDHLVCRL